MSAYLRTAPDDDAAWTVHGTRLVAARRPDEARKAFATAIRTNPANFRAWEMLLGLPGSSADERAVLARRLAESVPADGLAQQLTFLVLAQEGGDLTRLAGTKDHLVQRMLGIVAAARDEAGVGKRETATMVGSREELQAQAVVAMATGRYPDAAQALRQLPARAFPPAIALRMAIRRAASDGALLDARELVDLYLRAWPTDGWMRRKQEDVAELEAEVALANDVGGFYLDMVREGTLGQQPVSVLRACYRWLHRTGHLSHAVTVLKALVEQTRSERDAALLRSRQAELAFYQRPGSWQDRRPRSVRPPKRDRVLHIVGRSLPRTQNGYSLRTHHLVKAMRAQGVDALVFCQSGEGAFAPGRSWALHDGVPYHVHPGPSRAETGLQRWMELNREALRAVVRETRPAVLHAHSDFLNAELALIVGRETGIPVVYENRGFWEESWLSRTSRRFDLPELGAEDSALGQPDIYRLRRVREHEARRAADAVVTLAETMRDHIVSQGLPADRVILAPNGVNTADFTHPRPQPGLRAGLGIPEDATVLGYVSSLVEYEGIDVLIDAFEQVGKEPDRHLLIVGDGPEQQRLRRAAARSAHADRIHLPGSVSHDVIGRYYSAIDVFVVPRRPTPVCQLVTPLKPFEAMAAGCAVVVSDVAALEEIARDSGEAITTFTAGSPASLATALDELLSDPAGVSALGRAGRAWVERDRSWERIAARYLPLYGQLGLPMFGRPAISHRVG